MDHEEAMQTFLAIHNEYWEARNNGETNFDRFTQRTKWLKSDIGEDRLDSLYAEYDESRPFCFMEIWEYNATRQD